MTRPVIIDEAMVFAPPRLAPLTMVLAKAPPRPVEMFFAVTFSESAISPLKFPLTAKILT